MIGIQHLLFCLCAVRVYSIAISASDVNTTTISANSTTATATVSAPATTPFLYWWQRDKWWTGSSIPSEFFFGPTRGAHASGVSCQATKLLLTARERGFINGDYNPEVKYSTFTTNNCPWSLPPYEGRVTALCDGALRAADPEPSLAPRQNPDPSCLATLTLQTEPVFSANCLVPATDCTGIQQTFSSRSSAYEGSLSAGLKPSGHQPLFLPVCNPNPCDRCTIYPVAPKLLYWPVTTYGGGLCVNQTAYTLTPEPTDDSGPNTAVYGRYTLTSPTAYLSFAQISADSLGIKNQPASSCGSVHNNQILPVNPKDLSSYRDHHFWNRYQYYPGTVYPFNFADLNVQTIDFNTTMSVVPADAYYGQDRCGRADINCGVIRDDYRPDVVMPDSVRNLDPNWANCDNSQWPAPVIPVPITTDDNARQFAAATATNDDGSSQPTEFAVPSRGSPFSTVASTEAPQATTFEKRKPSQGGL